MNRFDALKRWTWSVFIVFTLAFAFAGCEGDDGAQGPPGPQGDQGPPGADGEDGSDASQVALETCGVCHGDGSFADATAAHAKVTAADVVDTGAFANFAVAPDTVTPADLIVSFSVTADGAAATNAAFGRAYVSVGGVARTEFVIALSDPPDPEEVLVEFTNNLDGTYSLRIPDGVALFGGTNSRYLVVVEAGTNELEIAAVGDYPAPIPLAGLASSEACVGCHGASGEVGRFSPTRRGGHYSAPISAQACVVCHRPDDPATPEDEEPNYMQFFRVVHGIHNSHEFPGDGFVTDRENLYNITYPTYMSNCSVCHRDNIVPATGGTALAAANAMPVSGRGCLSCHGAMENDDWDFTAVPFHLTNIPDPNTFDCTTGCHAPGGLATDKVVVADFHNGIATERSGLIWNGEDVAVTEAERFTWQITGVVDDGAELAISWTATYDGASVDPCNDAVGATAPVFFLPGGGSGGTFSMLLNYAQGDDFILGQSTSAPGQPNAVNLTAENTTCAGLVATTVIPAEDVVATVGRVALQGKPGVVSPASATELLRVRVPTPTFDWLIGTDDPAPARRAVVSTSECLKCHVGSLYQHGGNRVDNVDVCLLCHNSASNEKNVRVGMGVDASEAYDGKTGETFELKTMLHRIHSAGSPGSPPYLVYRNRGIYAFAPDVSLVPNWEDGGTEGCTAEEIADGERDAFGSDPTSANSCQPHNFISPDYPRALNACQACHTSGFAVIPDQTEAMATTVEAGSEEWGNQLDDTLQGAATTACITCHKDGASKGHAYQNSWVPQVFPDGRQTVIDAVR